MRFTTTFQLNKFYEVYKTQELTFSKEVMAAIGFKPNDTFVRCEGEQWQCIINTASMVGGKIICGKNSGFYEKLQAGHKNISIRFSFHDPDAKDPVSFFVSAKVICVSDYGNNKPTLAVINIEYTQRAPDDLIEKLGFLLDAYHNFNQRIDERITLKDKSIHKINLIKRETFVFIKGVPRRCILMDISFSGVKLIMVGVANFLVDSETTVKFDFENPQTSIGVKGTVIRAERVEDRKDLVAIAIEFHKDKVPVIFKMHLNKYFSQTKPPTENETDQR